MRRKCFSCPSSLLRINDGCNLRWLYFPLPTSRRVPAIIRTIFHKKPAPETSIKISPLFDDSTEHPSILLTVDSLPWFSFVKPLKSCSPSKVWPLDALMLHLMQRLCVLRTVYRREVCGEDYCIRVRVGTCILLRCSRRLD